MEPKEPEARRVMVQRAQSSCGRFQGIELRNLVRELREVDYLREGAWRKNL